MGRFAWSGAKLYFEDDRNRIRIKDKKLFNVAISSKSQRYKYSPLPDIFHVTHSRLSFIIDQIGNGCGCDCGGKRLNMTHDHPTKQLIIDASDTCFTVSNDTPKNGFIIRFGRYRGATYINIYAVQYYEKVIIIRYESGNALRINCGSLNVVPIVNRDLLKIITHIMNNYDKSVVDELEQLVDIYCSIVYLVNQINIFPITTKSARDQ
jgi:hypothetical protein